MIDLLRERWRDLLVNLWFVPLIVVLGYVLVAFALLRVDDWLWSSERIIGFGGDADAARSILSTTAGGLITIVGVTFSITIVVLQLASSQYSPRVLRMFFGDRITQATVGTFVGVFLYELLALRAVRNAGGEGELEFVPALTVTVGILFVVLALALLLIFINNVAALTQAETIAARIARSLSGPIEAVDVEGRIASDDALDGDPVRPRRAGYVQSVAPDEAARDLPAGRWTITARVPIGDFVSPDQPLALVRREEADGAEGAEDVDVRDDAVREAFRITDQRDVSEDPAFGLRQLGDMALKALSPGIHDPTTAVVAVGYMRSALLDLAGRRLGEREEELDDGRVVFRHAGRTLADYAEPLLEVGRHATEHVRVGRTVLEALVATLRRADQNGAPAPDLRARAIALGELLVDEASTEPEREAVARSLHELRTAAG